VGRPVNDKEIARILLDLNRAPLGMEEEEEFRISIAGAQEKTALLFWNGKWHKPHGSTPTTHILKPQIGKLPNGIDLTQSVENEHLCMRITAALGLPTATTKICDFDGRRALVIERFDRLWTRDNRLLRRPQEDCCQALSVPSARKYESSGGPGIRSLLELLRASDEPELDQRAFLKTQIVFWLLAAIDGHAKNFSIHLLPGGRFRLAPLYDVMSGQPARDAGQIQKNKLKLAMAIGEKRHYVVETIMPRHFMQTAKSCGMDERTVHGIFDELKSAISPAFEKVRSELPKNFPQALVQSVERGIRDRFNLFYSEARAHA
jgi:serine/threonine-protein kinase HipA